MATPRERRASVFLVDTSVWIEVFKKNTTIVIEEVVPLDEMVTCLPVVQEVLQGFREEMAYRRAREAMLAFPCVELPLSLSLFEEAIDLYRTARRAGVSIRSSTDCLIAAAEIRHGMVVLHRDRDYGNLAQVSSLKQRPL